MRLFNTTIYLKTFFKKGVPNIDGTLGYNSLIAGFQGSGKNYFGTFLLSEEFKDFKIKTNVKSMKFKNIEYFTKIEDIVNDTEEGVIYLIDEVSKKYNKEAKTDKAFYSWLQQSRKRKRRVYLITQEIKEVPMWLRRPIKYIYMTRHLFRNLYLSYKCDAQNGTLDEDKEWTYPKLQTFIYKRNKCVANLYDTFEPIEDL